MIEKDPKIERYYSLDPTRFSVLERLEVCQSHFPGEQPDLSLKIELLPPARDDERKLLLSFSGVRGLRFEQEATSLLQMVFITIDSIKGNGWEGLNYEVREEEENSLSFVCQSFDAFLEDNLGKITDRTA